MFLRWYCFCNHLWEISQFEKIDKVLFKLRIKQVSLDVERNVCHCLINSSTIIMNDEILKFRLTFWEVFCWNSYHYTSHSDIFIYYRSSTSSGYYQGRSRKSFVQPLKHKELLAVTSTPCSWPRYRYVPVY